MSSMAAMRVEARRPATRCALCHDDLRVDVGSCPDCGTATHGECRAEAGRCPTLGCAGVALRDRDEPRARPARLGPVAGVASLLLGFAAALIATGCPRHLLLLGTALPVALFLFALLGAAVDDLGRRAGRPGLVLGVATVLGAVATFAAVLALDGRMHP